MDDDDYKVFVNIVAMIKDGSIDKLSRVCFMAGVLAGLNSDDPDVNQHLEDLPEFAPEPEEEDVLDDMLDEVEEFKD